MPLEVTPVPFVEQQLPYNPKFIREPDVRANGEGSMAGGAASMVSGPGPLAAAASTLIAPTPGGVAGPHNAIPALPDAGYTAPGLRATGLGLDIGGSVSARSSLSDGYGPGGPASYRSSPYAPLHHPADAPGRTPHLPPPAPASALSSHSWAPSHGTFLGPRRTSNPALVPSLAESTIAPRGVSHHGGQAIDPRHQQDMLVPEPHGHHHHRPHHRRTRSHNRSERDEDDWDARSDASYYARPKTSRARSGSSLSDITNSSATVRPHHPHGAHHGHAQSARGSPAGQHEHSPISPSPLARDLPPPSHSQPVPSPLSPRSHAAGRRARKISDLGADSGVPPPQASPYKKVTPIPPDQDYSPSGLRTLHERSEKGGRRYSASYGSDAGDGGQGVGRSRRPKSPHGYASDDEGRYSSRSRGARREKSRHRYEDEGSVNTSISRRRHKHTAESYADDEYDDDRHYAHAQHSHSRSRVPPPLPYRAPSPAAPATLQVPGPQQHLMPDIGSLSISGEPQRRAHSMQQMQHPGGMVSSPASLAGFGPGAPGYGPGPYQTPSVAGMANADAYDDGASIAGSAMTFMDGAVAGRMSHYGLPKYPHQAKPDYRRFMVQRGKADVYLD